VTVHVLSEPEQANLSEIARLHHAALSYRSFITLFGIEFLERLYFTILERRLGFLIVAHEESRLIGFILASINSARLMSVVWRAPHRFVPLILRAVLRDRKLIRSALETLLYARKEQSDIKAELVVIAAAEGQRGRGVGSAMVRRMEEAFAQRGVSRYKVTVHREMTDANRFYERHGMRVARCFVMYGVEWNLYTKDIRLP
jgi:ribosomal protein S18 acetylase RimI-like enzyme